MTVIEHPTLARLKAGKLALGVGVRSWRSVEICKAMRTAGYDWLFIDLEHGTMPLDMAAQISMTADDVGITPIVRVPNGEYAIATRVLDNGAKGIVMPHVDTVDEAREIVRRLKYPPQGARSAGPVPPQVNFGALSTREWIGPMNDATILVVMIETAEAVRNAAEIAAVDGIDVLLVGTNDLCLDLGMASDFGAKHVADAYSSVIGACRQSGKWAGMAGVYDHALMRRYIDAGARFILSGADFNFMMDGARDRASFLHGIDPSSRAGT